MEPRIQYAKTEDGVSIAYWTMGKGTPLLVTPHSPMSWSLRSWQNPEARAYYEKVTQGRLVIHYDHRGTGNSEHDISEQSIETLVADIEAVANDVGLEEFALLGSYRCAPYAIAYAARHSERISKLIVLHASARGADFFNLHRLRKARESADEDPEFYLQLIAQQTFGWAGGKQAESWVSEVLKEANLHVLKMTLDTLVETDVMELLPQVEAPTLVLHRREVQYPSLDAARTLASGIPSAQLVVLEGDSLVHYSGDSDSFVSAINEFLGEGEETPAAEPKAEPPTQPPPTAAVRRTGAELMEQELGFCTTSDGVSIAYATVGEGPPLVYATGWPGHLSSEWETPHSRALIEDLAQGVTLIRYDMRGSGLSDREPGELSFEYWLTDLEAVVDHLQLESFALLSLGFLAGPICVAYSAAHPERVSHLIMSEGYMRGEELMTPERGKAIVDFISLYGFPVSFEGGDQSIERLQTIQDVSKIQNQAASLEVQGEVARNMLSVDVSSLVDKISMPTLIMHGSSDESIVPFRLGRNLAAAIPQAKFVAFDEPVSEPSRQQERITTEIRRFLGVEVEPKPKPTPPSAAEQGGAVAADTTLVSKPEAKTFASGRYVVVRPLGQGAQKSVYLVDDTVLGRQCALSMLNAALLDPSDVDRIKREAQTMAQLGTQPNIVTVHDDGEEDGAPFIGREY
ncbi:MAG: alpha/beta fold hydrolase, partial [Chloroflexi bacterium]|nr:alpha/beta fold hydrolase [Chloroflexota bacterium]